MAEEKEKEKQEKQGIPPELTQHVNEILDDREKEKTPDVQPWFSRYWSDDK
jgi:hypothetical protein